MDNLTDLEICKRIAEIDGVNVSELNGRLIPDCELSEATRFCGLSCTIQAHIYLDKIEYSPVTDNALCFELMYKYKVSVSYPENEFECGIVEVLSGNTDFFITKYTKQFHAGTPIKKAISLLIIERHDEDMNHE